VNDTKEEANAETAGATDQKKKMLEWLKTPSGAYNLTLIIAIVAWLGAGVAIYAGFHLNKVRTIESQRKARESEEDKARIKAELELATSKLEDAKSKLAALEEKTRPLTTAEKLMKFGTAVDARFPALIEEGQRGFRMNLSEHDFGVLRQIAREDTDQRLKIQTSTNTRVGPEGAIVEVTLTIGDTVFAARKEEGLTSRQSQRPQSGASAEDKK
jgi:hypothetical protein